MVGVVVGVVIGVVVGVVIGVVVGGVEWGGCNVLCVEWVVVFVESLVDVECRVGGMVGMVGVVVGGVGEVGGISVLRGVGE